MELTVTDQNDPAPLGREIYAASIAPVKVSIGKRRFTVLKTVYPGVGSATNPLTANEPITLTSSDGTCPAGTVDAVDFDYSKAGAQSTVNVPYRIPHSGSMVLTINGAAFTTLNRVSPTRCTALLTASSSIGDTDPTNNITRLVIDVTDRNDY
jgi:hypothetical protein